MWDWLNENNGAVTAIGTVAAVLIAAGAFLSNASQNRQRTRPMVATELRLATHSSTSMHFVVKNYGGSPAARLQIRFDPPIDEDKSTEDVRNRYGGTIASLNPGQELVNTWFTPRYVGNQLAGNTYAFPDKVKVTASYWAGFYFYKSTTHVDINVFKFSGDVVSSASHLGSMRSMRDSLKAIGEAVEGIEKAASATPSETVVRVPGSSRRLTIRSRAGRKTFP